MLKTKILNYIKKHNNNPITVHPKYLNHYSGEVTNTPIMWNLIELLYNPFTKHTIPYIFSWRRHRP